ncbi:MAG: AEC family transporter [Nitrososphaerota archaeon]|nr:AEC family transporter [Candidatus Bathyarchaeota archaeon]MDW8194079.1 AEC family transporter [Nitrososphaerota archaeon]
MEFDVALRTVIPIYLLIGLGFFSRRIGILKLGDERILSAYVYYFALPALLFVDLANASFNEQNIRFILAGVTPILIAVSLYLTLYYVLRFSKETLYLLVLSTVFGSLAFFGIPFVMFAFPGEGESLAALAASSISLVGVSISIVFLELHAFKEGSLRRRFSTILKKFSRNPLILSIILGLLVSLFRLEIPSYLYITLRMLGSTTATVAIFMLGVFFYGRRYANFALALRLSLLRMMFLPLLAIGTASLLNLPQTSTAILVIMHSVPVAVSLIVLSERYNFYRETIASLILVSSLSAAVYLNLWLLVLRV